MRKFIYGNVDSLYSQTGDTTGVVSEIIDNNGTLKINKGVLQQAGGEKFKGDPRVLAIKKFKGTGSEGTPLVLVTNYSYSGWEGSAPVDGKAKFSICNPTDGAWSITKNINSGVEGDNVWKDVLNPSAMLMLDATYLYIADYDTAKVTQIEAVNFTESAGNVNTVSKVDGYDSHCAGLAPVSEGTFLAVMSHPKAGTYSDYIDSTLALLYVNKWNQAVVYGPDKEHPTAEGAGKNPVGLTVANIGTDQYAFVSCIGGMQVDGGREDSTLEIFKVTETSLEKIKTISSSSADKECFNSVAVTSDGTAYVLRSYYNYNEKNMDSLYQYSIYRTTIQQLLTGELGKAIVSHEKEPDPEIIEYFAGATWGLAVDDGTLYAVCGDRLRRFKVGEDTEIDASTLLTTYSPDYEEPYEGALGYDGYDYGHINTFTMLNGNVSTTNIVDPVFISQTPAALKLRKEKIERMKKAVELRKQKMAK